MEKVTHESLAEDKDKLEKLQAKHSHPETSMDERKTMSPVIADLKATIKHDELILQNGNKAGKNGDPLIGKGSGFEITVKR